MLDLFSEPNQSLQRIASLPLSFIVRYFNDVHYLIDDCVFRSRRRTRREPLYEMRPHCRKATTSDSTD